MENHLIYIDMFTTALDKTSIGLSAASLLKTLFYLNLLGFFFFLKFCLRMRQSTTDHAFASTSLNLQGNKLICLESYQFI